MANQGSEKTPPDPARIGKTMADIAERSQKLVTDFMTRQATSPTGGMDDPMNIGQAFLDMTRQMMSHPERLVEAQMSLWQDYLALWQTTALRMMGAEAHPVATPAQGDRRFKDEAWDNNEVFDFIKQTYLLTARWMQGVVRDVDGMDRHTAEKVDFYTRQFVDAMAPSNFALTNPEVIRETLDSGGENLVKGLEHLLHDLERGKGQLRISMTDESAFEVGVNVAATPGKVIARNSLMELLQYTPTTEQVHKRPLLIIPPWINKYYILDLRPKNSFIKWAIDQGHSVFVISWVNPEADLAAKSFEDYMVEGPLAALDIIKTITGEDSVNAIGYCLGGTLLGCVLSYLEAKGQSDRIASATHFTAMLDFSEPGELGIFIDDQSLTFLEGKMNKVGYLDGSEMATTFNMLRANDLIWSFVVNNYLMGKDPFPFDLLYWNADSTRMPAAMHSFYLRKMYQENVLKDPGGVTLLGVPIDLRRNRTPSYFVSAREDHIAPWRSTFAGAQLYSGPVRFVLAASGHIAGVVNPPSANKYCFWTNTKKAKDAESWLEKASQTDGSWWTDWEAWVEKFTEGKVPARVPGDAGVPVLGDAPGDYVKVRAG
ncbi:PHA/PHB synthase family protein [Rhodospirillum rubrum]|uniref:Poly(R)-hydroxyalkanoic acid synthase, class I n=1 Tax=Rhodospirillum rubrum (strain ATCC 11170 / ATH 1.1.1 / DSM 467 / LMG 4362 / NCIMB 8255 / S1) TaxID=269796 RepID=Q2RRN2_RHORT|nr:class I poly(R)-hydroxyalkanoic acid synthase [Rhodospirillum rubrum]ABC23213.1 Poly(R)-hydroxyalkanoic acid synthase, class I [Rhodospirillum rubrum ATCC 11170]AEO48944.1 polyhydroxyalkanoate synthase [Rhodospirillum rubrum F11]MBK5954847.1 class I poly(R)-hydroxyalkanoic acid synthase [Rhodospirillum rubrum]QXG79190.1 class I poly(R)-hydroxyalkanoic acid synthase [Rhodospirillum rubrum]HAQ00088.1 class I poly(R)-hydroxyalkanoic acid synthase [Rhodospirillum rubrum]